MPNKSYQIGYRFEYRCKKELESQGYIVIRSGKSRFPDFVALRNVSIVLPKIFFGECKVNKYISKEEKNKADMIKLQTGLPFYVFYKENHKIRWYEYETKDT